MRDRMNYKLTDQAKKDIAKAIEEKGIELNKNKYSGIEDMLEVIPNDLLQEAIDKFIKTRLKAVSENVLDEIQGKYISKIEDPKARDIAYLYQSIINTRLKSDDRYGTGNRPFLEKHIINAGYICYAFAAGDKDLEEIIEEIIEELGEEEC